MARYEDLVISIVWILAVGIMAFVNAALQKGH